MRNPLSSDIYHQRMKHRDPDLRGDYFRDQTAIIHSTAFRRLKHKTQVFFSPANDHICTRIEHVLHVSTIATTICKGLGIDGELAQAIALGHDLGHAPFGHIGEEILNGLSKDIGGFIHEVHSLRVVDRISDKGRGLNLTYAVRDGIVSHCGESFTKTIRPQSEVKDLLKIRSRQSAPLTWEGCVVRVADKIAYLGRDIEDAISAGLITAEDVPAVIKKELGRTNGEIINALVLDVVKHSSEKDGITFSNKRYDMLYRLKEFNYEKIYKHKMIIKSDRAIKSLLQAMVGHLRDMYKKHGFDPEAYEKSSFIADRHFAQYFMQRMNLYENDANPERAIVDFVAGMTDSYALDSARDILFPHPLGTY